MRLKYISYLKSFPLNIVSDERFNRRDVRLRDHKIISLNCELLSLINVEWLGFPLWVHNQPKSVKIVFRKKNFTVTSKRL